MSPDEVGNLPLNGQGPARMFKLAPGPDRSGGEDVEISLCYFFKAFFFAKKKSVCAQTASQTSSVWEGKCYQGSICEGDI